MTDWPMVVFFALLTVGAVYIGKWWFNGWFNPLSIYSAVWGVCLVNYELRLLQYYEISRFAWICILTAWLSLYLGAGIVVLFSTRITPPARSRSMGNADRLKRIILGLSAIGGAGLISQLFAISKEFGNPLVALITDPGEIYGARLYSDLSGLSYAGSFMFAACTLAGIYTARVAKLTWVAAVPLLLIVLQLFSAMGRTGLGVAAVLFVVSFVYTPKPAGLRIPKWQRASGAVLALTLAATFITVSAIRHLDVNFVGITPKMEEISEYVPFFPSIYSNFSATPVAFSLYLQTPEQEKPGFWGMYTFAPVFRFLSRLGFQCDVPAHEESYYTPVPMNTGTYLKNIYSDFGFAGIVVFPFLLAACLTFLISRASRTPGTLSLALVANLFVLVVFAFAFNFMVLGDWYIGLGGSTLGAIVADHT